MSVKTAGVGHFAIPTAPAAGTSCTSGAANVFTTTYVQLIASTAAALYITGLHIEAAGVSAATYKVLQLATGGAGSETIVGQYLCPLDTQSTVVRGYRPIFPPIPVAISTRIAVKTADSVGAQATLITLECIAQSNVVDDGIAVGTVTLVTTATTVTNQLTAAAIATGVWQDAVVGDFTAASSIGKTLYIANVAPGAAGGHFIAGTNAATTITTGLTTTFTGNVTGSVASVTGAVGSVTGLTAANLDATVSSRMATYTQPAGFLAATFPTGTVANTTNITAGTITTATNLTNAPTVGDLTAAMKTSVTTAATAATPTAAAVTGAVGSVTGNVGGNVVGSVASVTADVGITQGGADKAWSSAARTLTAFGFSVTVGTNNDKTGYTLSAAGIQAVWDALTSALSTVGSIGKLLVDNINAAITTRSSHSAADVWTAATRTLTSFGTLAADVWANATRLLTAGTNIVLAKGTGITGFNDPSAAAAADALLARNQKGGSDTGFTVAQALASGAMRMTMNGAVMTVQYHDGTTAFTRTLTAENINALIKDMT